MKRMLEYADKYLQKSNWKDIGIIKYCLFSFGLLTGTYIPQKNKECVRIIAIIGFIVTTTLIMTNFFPSLWKKVNKLDSNL